MRRPVPERGGDEGSLLVQRSPCASCIYRKACPLDVAALEDEVRDPHMPAFFTGYRICHHSTRAVCAGFWVRHHDAFTLGQLATRLGLVRFVDEDRFKEKEQR
jgi:hypothetical protein